MVRYLLSSQIGYTVGVVVTDNLLLGYLCRIATLAFVVVNQS